MDFGAIGSFRSGKVMGMRQGSPLLDTVTRLAFVCAVAGASAACSTDAMRFTDTPFTNPFSSSSRVEPQTTASVAPTAAPSSPVQSQALPPVGAVTSSALPPPSAAPARMAAAAPVAASSASGPVGSLPGAKGWTTHGGSTVTAGASDTVKSLSNRYGVPETAIRAANGLTGAAQPAPGAAVLIPVYNASAAAAPNVVAAVPPAARTVAAAPQASVAAAPAQVGKARMKLVQGAQPAATKAVTAATPAAPPPAAVAVAPVKAPSVKVAEVKPAPAKAAEVKPAPAKTAEAKTTDTKATETKTAAVRPAVQVPAITPIPTKPTVTAKADPAGEPVKSLGAGAKQAVVPGAPAATVVEATEATGSIAASAKPSTEFRWPAKGRVISGFGGKGGGSNDGINISLPEGTPVKAAEGGTVAYAGNELKGYGNLVLIRHPDGWVSAYAHNGDLKVKRGDTVSRGQTIATSGASGNVSSPQLHFELRKGSTPVDPMPHLAGT
jgi:murein DD-endopeptidase MepM/ murein hydrolase activator NlpD